MGKLLAKILLVTFILLGCTQGVRQEGQEQEVLTEIQNGIWGEGAERVEFDRRTKTYRIVSGAFAAMAQRELDKTHTWILYESWEDFVDTRIKELYEEKEDGVTIGSLGSGYKVKIICPSTKKPLLIAKDGELIFDIVHSYVK